MKTKLTVREYILLASMLFGMFFGAGNLIFPAQMGQMAGAAMWPAVAGFCLTGVGLPLLGIAAMGISRSEGLFDMSSKVGKRYGYFFTCALYLSIGPLFAIPRTATVSFQIGIFPLIGSEHRWLALLLFSFLFFAAVLYFSLKPSGILTWIGKVLNPLFLVFLGTLLGVALLKPMGSISQLAPMGAYAKSSFFTGFLEGYNTMDVLAALAFGIILINVIRGLGVSDPKRISFSTIRAGFFSILMMAVIYCAITIAGAQSRSVYGICDDGGAVLHVMATHYFGMFGGLLLGMIITFACLKTSIGLVTSCSTTFSELFPRIGSYRIWAILFSLLSFLIANMGLNRIIEYSLPVLMFLYPLSIVLILLCLFGSTFQYRRCVFDCTILATALAASLDFVHALPEALRAYLPFDGLVEFLLAKLPFADIGMGWIIPAAVGFAVGMIWKMKNPIPSHAH